MKITCSVAVIKGEEEKLQECLASAKNFCDEIIILNLEADKGKLAVIAKKFAARVVDEKFTVYVETVRNKMIEAAQGGWVLILDPDERLSPKLKEKLQKIVEENQYSAVNIPRKNIFFGHWINFANWWPDRHVRFFKKGVVAWEDIIHKYPSVKGSQLDLPARGDTALIHYGYDSVGEFIDRHNRYSDIEAANRLKAGEKPQAYKFIWWPTREFLARYIKHGGWRGGALGFMLVTLMLFYKFQVLVKMWEKLEVKKE